MVESSCYGSDAVIWLSGCDRSWSGLLVLCLGDVRKLLKNGGSHRFYSTRSEGCAEIVHISLMVNVLQCRTLRFVSPRHHSMVGEKSLRTVETASSP